MIVPLLQKFEKTGRVVLKETAKTPQAETKIFGRSIQEVVQIQRSLGSSLFIPLFAHQILEFLFLRGLSNEGIFRLGGLQENIRVLKERIDAGMKNK